MLAYGPVATLQVRLKIACKFRHTELVSVSIMLIYRYN